MEIEKIGVPVVQISAVPDVAKMLCVNRILRGQTVPNVLGNSTLSRGEEKQLRRKYVLRAIEILGMPVLHPQVFTLSESNSSDYIA